jgi:hypothetical protein
VSLILSVIGEILEIVISIQPISSFFITDDRSKVKEYETWVLTPGPLSIRIGPAKKLGLGIPFQ